MPPPNEFSTKEKPHIQNSEYLRKYEIGMARVVTVIRAFLASKSVGGALDCVTIKVVSVPTFQLFIKENMARARKAMTALAVFAGKTAWSAFD